MLSVKPNINVEKTRVAGQRAVFELYTQYGYVQLSMHLNNTNNMATKFSYEYYRSRPSADKSKLGFRLNMFLG